MNDKKTAREHLERHQNYPASRKDILASCNNLSDFRDDDRKFVENTLPDRTFYSASEVETILGL